MEAANSSRKSNKSRLGQNDGVGVASDRPFSAMGSAVLHLQSTAPEIPSPDSPYRSTGQLPLTAGAMPNRSKEAVESEFDVRKFLLDQKSTQPFHKSSLFRTTNFAKQISSMDTEETNQTGRLKPKHVMLPRMELGASKSTGMLPGSRGKSRATSRNQQTDEEDNTHFYSVEKMTTSCFHATQNKNKTWLFLPGSDERSKRSKGSTAVNKASITGVERPSRRVDLLDLDRCFDTAIQCASKKNRLDVACEEKLSMLDQDFMATHARVAQRYGPATANESTTDDRTMLTKLIFEQKWSDVILGELEYMLTVSFLEQGVLLRKARILYAKTFFHLEQLYQSQSQELIQEKQEVEYLREEIRQTNELHKQNAQGMKEHYEDEISKLKTNFENDKSEMERRVTDSKDQMTKMGDTMKALNAIFRQMRDDTEKVKAVELRENYNRLEHKYEQCREEIEQLRPVVQEKQQLLSQIDELIRDRDAYKDQITSLNSLVGTKDTMIASLMEQHSNLIAAQDLKAAREEEMRRQAEEDAEDEKNETPITTGDFKRRGSNSSTSVCVRCKQDLRTMSTKGGMADGDKTSGNRSHGNSVATKEDDAFKLPKKR